MIKFVSVRIARKSRGRRAKGEAVKQLDEKTVAARIRGEQERTIANVAAETKRPDTAFWLSFADASGFRGAVIVHANDFVEALMRCNLLDINPHGECQGMPIPAEGAAMIPEKWKYRILTREECAKFDEEMSGGGEV